MQRRRRTPVRIAFQQPVDAALQVGQVVDETVEVVVEHREPRAHRAQRRAELGLEAGDPLPIRNGTAVLPIRAPAAELLRFGHSHHGGDHGR